MRDQKPVRVLMYTAYFAPEYSGAALQALTLARELRKRGHHVEFVTNRWPGLAETTTVDGFAVQRLEPGRALKHREFRLWFNLARYVWRRRHEFDVLHSHGAYITHAFVGPLARLTGLHSLVKASLANDDLQGLAHGLAGRLHRMMLRQVDAYVGISRDLVDEFRIGGMDPAKVHFLPNGVDTERFHRLPKDAMQTLRRARALPTDRQIALYVGVLDQRKNILWLAEQWIRQRAFGTGALLLAAGPQGRDDVGGMLQARLAELARAHPDLFALQEFRADIEQHYQCADVLVLPSYKEGLPNAMLEAMASGLPCVAARASGSRELVVEGKTGFTYAPDDVAELADAIRKSLAADGADLGANARQLAEQRYAIRLIAEGYERLYRNLLGQT